MQSNGYKKNVEKDISGAIIINFFFFLLSVMIVFIGKHKFLIFLSILVLHFFQGHSTLLDIKTAMDL